MIHSDSLAAYISTLLRVKWLLKKDGSHQQSVMFCYSTVFVSASCVE